MTLAVFWDVPRSGLPLVVRIYAACALLGGVAALDNGLLLTPPMGMNTWIRVGTTCTSEEFLLSSANYIVAHGLAALGYTWICSDDGWDTHRNATGHLQADPKKFPSGIPELVARIHALGLSLGLYGSSSSVACSGRPGSLYLEDIDAETYASWGVDYIKQDDCGEYALGMSRFQAFADAINRTGRRIAISTEPFSLTPTPLHARFSNLWRTGNDIRGNYATVVARADLNDKWAVFSGPGRWADPDLLQCGNGLSDAECRANFGLWAVMKAPLILGTNVTLLTPATLAIISNRGVIAVNQDALGIQATKRAAGGRVSPKFVGLAPCAGAGTVPGHNGVTAASLQWLLHPLDHGGNTFAISHPATNRCLATRPYLGRALPVPVLLPCVANDSTQQWLLPRPTSVGGLINVALNMSLMAANSTVYGVRHGTDVQPLLDAAYGLSNLTFGAYTPEPPCASRDCDNYVPQQTFYASPTTGTIALAMYAANMCDGLTAHLPAPSNLCLAHVASISNDGVDMDIKGVHVWAGPLSGNTYVMALDNRDTHPTVGVAPFSLLEVAGIGPESKMCVRDLYADTSLGVYVGSITLTVPPHDIFVLKLFPDATSC